MTPIGEDEPVDGFTVERDGTLIAVTLSNRYGHADRFVFEATDAIRLARVLQAVASATT